MTGSTVRAYWVTEPGRGELRDEPARRPGPAEVLVRTLFTGISRGTETTVFRGGVPASEHERMRAPFQEGEFPGPVKYGYLNVGLVEDGPTELLGRTVFSLAPHQSASVLPAASVVLVPESVPARRAVLAGIVETALNALWDSPLLAIGAVTVVGAGLLGCCIARLAVLHPGVTVTLVDVDRAKAGVAQALGVGFASPSEAPLEQDAVFHASATAAGLQLSLDLLRVEGTVTDVSWYGDRPVELQLGGVFHSRRLTIRSSQVGLVAPSLRATTTPHDRLGLAVALLADPAFDVLLTAVTPFEELPVVMARIARGELPGLCHVIEYSERTS